ncbi:hypothetical protein PZA11_001881 [Diplocarpon coronariae]
MLVSIAITIDMVIAKLSLPCLPTVIYIDSLSLYKCIIKLGTIKEKRLIINIIAIRQSYENRELIEIHWIDSASNPANAIIKANLNQAL